ncbi:MAG: DNA-binding protein [Alphaproteobacteria bacterium]|nr:DNA-binding protein [Alphaproteobacteria bacterium]
MSYTVGQAAKATGKSKPTISRAIKNGSISATKNDDGSYTIDPSELHRVFPPVKSNSNDETDLKPSETPSLQREIELLRELLTDKDGVIDDLRQRLDREGEERRQAQAQLTALLSDQRAPEPQARRSWWRWGK